MSGLFDGAVRPGSKMFILYTVDGSAKDFISISIMDPRKI